MIARYCGIMGLARLSADSLAYHMAELHHDLVAVCDIDELLDYVVCVELAVVKQINTSGAHLWTADFGRVLVPEC